VLKRHELRAKENALAAEEEIPTSLIYRKAFGQKHDFVSFNSSIVGFYRERELTRKQIQI
jgi:hypothetical protein